MAKKLTKFGPRKRYAGGGSTDQTKARYDRKIADIESDYAKAKARKTGRAAEVAEAKYNQRMADAKDDFAKWTGGDRTQTRAAESAAERNLTMTRRYGAVKPVSGMGDTPLATPKAMSDADVAKLTSTARQGVSDAGGFGSAFKAARAAGDKTFTWRGKSYTTQTAGEGRSAARPASRASAPARPAAAATRTPAPTPGRAPTPAPGRAPASAPAKGTSPWAKDAKGNWVDPGARGTRMGDVLTLGLTAAARNYYKNKDKADADAKSKAEQEARARATRGRRMMDEAITSGKKLEAPSLIRAASKKKGGAVKKYAKGGKIDGCAVRGKTRTPMKKGK